MTELLFQTDAYLKAFDAGVTHVDGDLVALDRTAFYPRGGGQPSDRGELIFAGETHRVLEAKKQGGEVWHKLERAAPAVAGAQVRGRLDWERRYQLMRTHTALHILCGVIWRDYGVHVTGGDMEPLTARMDFELERMSVTFAQEV